MLCFIFILVKISISFVSKVFLTLSNLIHKNQQMSVAPLLWWLTIWSLSTNFSLQILSLYGWKFFPKSACSQWLLRGHMKFSNELFPAKISVGKTAKSMILESNSAIYPPTENLSKNVFEGRTSTGTGVFSLLTHGCTRVCVWGGGGAPLLRFFLIFFFLGDNVTDLQQRHHP